MRRCLLTALIIVQLAVVPLGCRRSVPPETADDNALEGSDTSAPEADSEESDITVREAIFQVVLNLPELDAYWHVDDAPDRSPLLLLANEETPAELVLMKFDQPVEVLSAEEIGERPHFVFRSFERSGNQASVSFVYEVEGVIGTVELEQTEGLWIVTERSVSEQ